MSRAWELNVPPRGASRTCLQAGSQTNAGIRTAAARIMRVGTVHALLASGLAARSHGGLMLRPRDDRRRPAGDQACGLARGHPGATLLGAEVRVARRRPSVRVAAVGALGRLARRPRGRHGLVCGSNRYSPRSEPFLLVFREGPHQGSRPEPPRVPFRGQGEGPGPRILNGGRRRLGAIRAATCCRVMGNGQTRSDHT